MPCVAWQLAQLWCAGCACKSALDARAWHVAHVGAVSPGRWWQLAQARCAGAPVCAAVASAAWQVAQRVHQPAALDGRSRCGAWHCVQAVWRPVWVGLIIGA